ncbi:MAG: FMN reductase [Burkholderiales bacterium PBB4]|nr:MAG: FMN reductase [Burkholderiales bacterium PBB4]
MKLLLISGSARKESYNAKLAAAAAKLASAQGVETDLVAAADLRLPLYDGDLEEIEGLPTAVVALKARFLAADAVLFACPEYNSSITPLLKNLIDWVSRAGSDSEAPLAAYKGKVAGLVSASPGALGGMRGLVTVRSILGNIGVLVVPTQFALGKAHEAFDTEGNLSNDSAKKSLAAVVNEVIRVAKAIAGK